MRFKSFYLTEAQKFSSKATSINPRTKKGGDDIKEVAILRDKLTPLFKSKGYTTIIDYGSGSKRAGSRGPGDILSRV